MPAPRLTGSLSPSPSGAAGTATLLRDLPGRGTTPGLSPAANKIIRFFRGSGLPAPPPEQISALGAGLERIRQFAGALPRIGAIGLVTMLGGDSRQEEPGTHLLARLARGRANLDRTFEALDGLVRERTGWPDITGERAALQSLLTSSRRRIESLASREPEQAARQLAALFKLFELRAGGSDQGRLAAARGILARSGAARPAAELNETPARPANAAAPAPAPVRAPSPEVVAARQATQAIGRLRDAIRASNAVPSAAAHKDLTAARDRASRLYQRDGPLWSSATVRQYRDFLTQANAALDRPLPSAQGATVVEALGKAIRAYDAAPGSSAREGLNDALALARSLNRKQGVHWTPATRENFDALARQAQARLYPHSTAPSRPASPPLPGEQAAAVPQPPQPLHLPAPGARVEHTGGDVRTPAQIEEEHLARVAQRLEEARNAYYERRKTQLAGGDETALVARIYEEMGLRSLGVSQEQFQNHLKAAGQPSREIAARVTAGDSGAGTLGGGGPHAARATAIFGPDSPEELQARFLRDGVLIESDASHARRSPLTPEEERTLVEFVAWRGGDEGEVNIYDFSSLAKKGPLFQRIFEEVNEVLEAMKRVTGLPLEADSVHFRMHPASVHLDTHRDGDLALFRYFRRLSEVGTPTTLYPFKGKPITLHETTGAVISGTGWRRPHSRNRDLVEYLRKQGHAVGYRAAPHGLIVMPGLRVGETRYVEVPPAGSKPTDAPPDRQRLFMVVEIRPLVFEDGD